MARRAGRIFVTAPLSYLSECESHTQSTWDELTNEGKNDVQRDYIIQDKIATICPKSSRGRKSSPPFFWLSENEMNTHELWSQLSKKEQIANRIKFTTGKYRRKIDEGRKEKKKHNLFSSEKRGRPARISEGLLYVCDKIMSLSTSIIEDNKRSSYLSIFSYIDSRYEHYVESLYFPILNTILSIVQQNTWVDINITAVDISKQLLSSSKANNIRIKALNEIWDRLKGKKQGGRSRRFYKPFLYTEPESKWKTLDSIEQLFIIHELELLRYSQMSSDQTDLIENFTSIDEETDIYHDETCHSQSGDLPEITLDELQSSGEDYMEASIQEVADRNTISSLLNGFGDCDYDEIVV